MNSNFLLLFLTSVFFSTKCSQATSIIIVGAGPSGIAAATRLLQHNFSDIRILEAEGRVGGRIRSVKFGDAYIDLGAEWCHGEEGNIVYQMIKEYDVLRHTNLSQRLVYSDGQYIDDDVYRSLLHFSESIDASKTNPVTEEHCKNISSIGECFDILFNLTFLQKYENDTNKLRFSLDSRNWLQSYMLGYDSTLTLDDLSRRSTYKICNGDLRLNWNGLGYKTILDLMIQKFPDPKRQLPIDDKILLNKEITTISWNTSGAFVSIRCLDNTSYEADHIIFTPSLGVLKAQYQSLFEPALPEEKIRAIKNFGFGTVFKISLHFSETWWNADELFGIVWSAEDEANISIEFPFGPVKNGRSWLTYSVKFFQAEKNPKVMMIFFAGDIVPELEKESDSTIIRGCMYIFQKFLAKNHTVVQPDKILRSSWYSNPHFRGTYSYESVSGNSAENAYPEKLKQPLRYGNGDPAVLFAGEATHPYYFSTVHGAIETGYREADQLINLYKHP